MFKAHRLLYHSTLGSRVIKKKKKSDLPERIALLNAPHDRDRSHHAQPTHSPFTLTPCATHPNPARWPPKQCCSLGPTAGCGTSCWVNIRCSLSVVELLILYTYTLSCAQSKSFCPTSSPSTEGCSVGCSARWGQQPSRTAMTAVDRPCTMGV